MAQEEKDLLLKDLCARLPYGIWVQYEGKEWLVTGYGHGRVLLLPSVFSSVAGPCPLVEEVKLYLRPMSSMTEEEFSKLNKECYHNLEKDGDDIGSRSRGFSEGYEYLELLDIRNCIDWLNAHHFDYRGLIEKGIALVAPEGMYKTE